MINNTKYFNVAILISIFALSLHANAPCDDNFDEERNVLINKMAALIKSFNEGLSAEELSELSPEEIQALVAEAEEATEDGIS